jgi:6-phosphofructokinase 1
MASQRRIGILTAGGDCPGLNAVIRGVVKSANTHGYEVIGFLRGYEGLVDPVTYIPLTHKNTTGILSQGGTILGSTNKGRFVATVGINDRKELDPELVAGVKATVEQLSLEGLICVGGDGSLAVAQQFHENGIPVVGVPKTIDNDLSSTAFSFGFFSAVFCATDALDRLHTTAASHERVMVLEVMGRHAGWIALFAGIAGGGDVILIPEIPWTFENVCQAIISREQRGKRFTLVVVAEGAKLPSGELVARECRSDQGQVRLGGIGTIVGYEIERRLGKETRTVVLGHLQRGGNPTTFDRVLATQLGAHAVRLILERKFGRMVTYQPPEIEDVPILDAIRLSTVSPDCSAVQAARALGISFGDDCRHPPFQPACGDTSQRTHAAPSAAASRASDPAQRSAEPETSRAAFPASRPVNPRK